MSLIHIKDACLSFSNSEILKNAVFYINQNERVCLIGKNGAGKSTLLKIINKKQDLDLGQITYKKNIKITYVSQENPKKIDISIYDFIGLELDEKHINKETCYLDQIKISKTIRIEKIINEIKIKKHTLLSQLSGGLLRKVALSQALVRKPNILLLDEPTNHLDIKSVKWLEKSLKKFPGSVLFVSHDRSFIQNIATRIVDLDRGKLISWPGNYQNFIKLKTEKNRIENIQKKIFDKNLEKEEIWINQGVKARTTRNEGRVKNLKKLRKENSEYQKIKKLENIKINQIKNYPGKIIFKIKNIHYSIKNKLIVNNFSEIVQKGDKIGLIGDNGCGKSTLIKIILGKIKPDHGEIHIGKTLNIAYFDQNKSILNPNKSILENISYGKEKVTINGKEQHVLGYLKSFLFESSKLTSLVKTLSGGERSRLLLARLFLKPSNVLILDEPTNDLDLDTLQLLEKIVINYLGTVIIVSHDEEFIKNTVNKFWLFQGNGYIDINFKQYTNNQNNHSYIKKEKKTFNPNFQKTIKIKNNLKQEIKKTLNKIEKIEKNIKNLQFQINQPHFFSKKTLKILPILKLLSQQEKELEEQSLYWEHLEKKLNK